MYLVNIKQYSLIFFDNEFRYSENRKPTRGFDLSIMNKSFPFTPQFLQNIDTLTVVFQIIHFTLNKKLQSGTAIKGARFIAKFKDINLDNCFLYS